MRTPAARKSPPSSAHAGAETVAATIEALNYDGSGVAHVDGKVVFIDGALPGEHVLFRYRRRHRRYDTGEMVQILSASPERIATPECPYFGICGGCSLQHLQPEAQLVAKQRVLHDNLTRIGKVMPVDWLAPLRGPLWGYRRKARLGVRLVPKKGGVLVGFRERKRSFITPLADCKTLDPRLAALLPALPALITGLSCPQRIPQIEVAAGDQAVALVFRHLDPLNDADRERLRAFGEEHTVQIHLQAQGPESVLALWPPRPPLLSYLLPAQGIEILFAANEFTQVNAAVNTRLVDSVLELLDPQPHETVVDLFCGVGNFTLPLAHRAARVVGMEGSEALVRRAQANAEHNKIANADFRQVDLYNEATPIPWDELRLDKLLLDPPRSGAMEAIKQLPVTHMPSRVVYVSCYPATLARDSEYLVHALGFRLLSAGIADMFPHTSHMEAIAVFARD